THDLITPVSNRGAVPLDGESTPRFHGRPTRLRCQALRRVNLQPIRRRDRQDILDFRRRSDRSAASLLVIDVWALPDVVYHLPACEPPSTCSTSPVMCGASARNTTASTIS